MDLLRLYYTLDSFLEEYILYLTLTFLRQLTILLLSEKQQQHIFFIVNSSFLCDVISILHIAAFVQSEIVIIGYCSE